MSDRVLLSASPINLRACLELATRHKLGIELVTFASPEVLDGDVGELIAEYRALLEPVQLRALHGPFIDMSPGSLDQKVNALVMARYCQALDIAAELDVKTVVFHANIIASLRTHTYREGWTERTIAFFSELAPYACERGVTIAVENMWEYEPSIIGDVLAAVNHPSLRACLDVGHARLFGEVALAQWLAELAPFLHHVHLNNNDGQVDVHRALGDGVVDYHAVLPELRAAAPHATLTLEMDTTADMEASLRYFEL